MRILGLDVGTKRTGVAVSDELLCTAQGLDSIECGTAVQDVERIARLVEQHGVERIVVGLPLNMDGTEGAKASQVRAFIAMLSARVGVPVETWDERLTSMQADRILLEADLSRRKRRTLSDKVAAQLILQGYLDARRSKSQERQ